MRSDGERAVWDEMQLDAVPEVVFLSSKRRTASKRHVCDSCGQTIRTGESYARQAWTEDGEFNSSKVCASCDLTRPTESKEGGEG